MTDLELRKPLIDLTDCTIHTAGLEMEIRSAEFLQMMLQGRFHAQTKIRGRTLVTTEDDLLYLVHRVSLRIEDCGRCISKPVVARNETSPSGLMRGVPMSRFSFRFLLSVCIACLTLVAELFAPMRVLPLYFKPARRVEDDKIRFAATLTR